MLIIYRITLLVCLSSLDFGNLPYGFLANTRLLPPSVQKFCIKFCISAIWKMTTRWQCCVFVVISIFSISQNSSCFSHMQNYGFLHGWGCNRYNKSTFRFNLAESYWGFVNYITVRGDAADASIKQILPLSHNFTFTLTFKSQFELS